MKTDYVSTVTKEWMFEVFSRMTESELSDELSAMRESRNLYLSGNFDIVSSFVFEFIDNVYDVAKDVLVLRFIHTHASPDSQNGQK